VRFSRQGHKVSIVLYRERRGNHQHVMGNMYDRLLAEVRVYCSRRVIVSESEIRIDKETQLYGQLIKGCIL